MTTSENKRLAIDTRCYCAIICIESHRQQKGEMRMKQVTSYSAKHWRRYALRNAKYALDLAKSGGSKEERWRGYAGYFKGISEARKEQKHIDSTRRIMAASVYNKAPEHRL